MLEKVMEYGILFYVMGIMAVAGVTAKIISYITVEKFVRAASDIQKSNHRFMRFIKAKFEHASMVSERVQNVEAFVQKYLYEYRALGMRVGNFRSLPFKMAWLVAAIGSFGAVVSYQMQGMNEGTFRYGVLPAIYTVILITIHILSDEKTKLEAAKNYIVEYLENVCVHRYEKANKMRSEEVITDIDAKLTEQLNEATQSEEEPELEMKLQMAQEEQVEKEEDGQNEQEMRIRAILQEFLA